MNQNQETEMILKNLMPRFAACMLCPNCDEWIEPDAVAWKCQNEQCGKVYKMKLIEIDTSKLPTLEDLRGIMNKQKEDFCCMAFKRYYECVKATKVQYRDSQNRRCTQWIQFCPFCGTSVIGK